MLLDYSVYVGKILELSDSFKSTGQIRVRIEEIHEGYEDSNIPWATATMMLRCLHIAWESPEEVASKGSIKAMGSAKVTNGTFNPCLFGTATCEIPGTCSSIVGPSTFTSETGSSIDMSTTGKYDIKLTPDKYSLYPWNSIITRNSILTKGGLVLCLANVNRADRIYVIDLLD